ncbi:MAG TPA: carbon storage regulator CsrA [Isosphaeraceae bacterium]|nr:carbon storage regulator CsrA [Isosphaeraceae bacterium]
MLVLSRKRNEAIVINGDIRIMVVDVRGNQVRLGIEAPDSVRIFRKELCDRAGGGEQLEGRVEASELSGHARN